MKEQVDLYRMGRRIRRHRLAAGYTQTAVAELTELAISNYHKIEKGQSGIRVETLCRLCTVLRCTPNDLLGYGHADGQAAQDAGEDDHRTPASRAAYKQGLLRGLAQIKPVLDALQADTDVRALLEQLLLERAQAEPPALAMSEALSNTSVNPLALATGI